MSPFFIHFSSLSLFVSPLLDLSSRYETAFSGPSSRSETTASLRPPLYVTSPNSDHPPPHETHLGISSNPSHSIDLHEGSPSPFRVFTGASSSHLQI
ncbi:hypothetical protein QJS10_CPA01g01501 [Acorus calamus]|uniref:Uncharacterized protein n=1 Tax=Acorus calamus TaxID=4465 RepID=A0AAV9FGA2_ACOCL|nr:hypothetical protein QJS10_CPA01g01501 [Acorus calamus]